MAHYYILASMAGVLQHQFQLNDSSRAIMISLKEMFGVYSRSARQIVMQKIMDAKMLEGTPIWEYILKMISFLNELETLGANIFAQTEVDMMRNSQPQSFAQFKHNYNMNQMNFSMSELMSSLQVWKGWSNLGAMS